MGTRAYLFAWLSLLAITVVGGHSGTLRVVGGPGRKLFGCGGIGCITGDPDPLANTPADPGTWTGTRDEAKKRLEQGRDDAANDIAAAEKKARDQFSSYSKKYAESAAAKSLASAIEAVGAAQGQVGRLEKSIKVVQEFSYKAKSLNERYESCMKTMDVAACEAVLQEFKELVKPLADESVENTCTDREYQDFKRGWTSAAGSPIWDSKAGATAVLSVFPGTEGMAAKIIEIEIQKQFRNLLSAFEKFQKSAVAWGNQQVKSFDKVLEDLVIQLKSGRVEEPKFDIPALEMKLAIVRSNCVNRLKMKGFENVAANAEGNYRWVIGWRFKGGFDENWTPPSGSSNPTIGSSNPTIGRPDIKPLDPSVGGRPPQGSGNDPKVGSKPPAVIPCSMLQPCQQPATCTAKNGGGLCLVPLFGECACV